MNTKINTKSPELIATDYYSPMMIPTVATYNGLSSASDGKIYYALPTDLMDKAAQLFAFDPRSGSVEHLADLTEICGEKDKKLVAQGKVHVNFYEMEGKIYFATHLGYYVVTDNLEEIAAPKDGFSPYAGGHFLSFDLTTKEFQNLGVAPNKEGIITMSADSERGVLYGITWPTGMLLRYNVSDNRLENLGPTTMGNGEAGETGKDYRVVCRSIVVNPDDGTIYLTNSEGEIKYLKFGERELKTAENVSLKKDYFGNYDISSTRSMGYNWRQAFWNNADKKIYGLNGTSGYLFSYDPATAKVEVLERLTSLPSKRSGMFDAFDFGYLSFALGPDGHTVFYLTSAPSNKEPDKLNANSGGVLSTGLKTENIDLHLITFDTTDETYKDHGPVFLRNGESPFLVNSITFGLDGTIYALGRIRDKGNIRTDLMSIPNPLN